MQRAIPRNQKFQLLFRSIYPRWAIPQKKSSSAVWAYTQARAGLLRLFQFSLVHARGAGKYVFAAIGKYAVGQRAQAYDVYICAPQRAAREEQQQRRRPTDSLRSSLRPSRYLSVIYSRRMTTMRRTSCPSLAFSRSLSLAQSVCLTLE